MTIWLVAAPDETLRTDEAITLDIFRPSSQEAWSAGGVESNRLALMVRTQDAIEQMMPTDTAARVMHTGHALDIAGARPIWFNPAP